MASKTESGAKTLDLIADYVTWAAEQTSDDLASAVDLAFLLPMFRDERLYDLFRARISPEMLATKRSILIDDEQSQ